MKEEVGKSCEEGAKTSVDGREEVVLSTSSRRWVSVPKALKEEVLKETGKVGRRRGRFVRLKP